MSPIADQKLINTDVLVIGAGIMGLSIARELILRGRTVVVATQYQPEQSQSRFASGILSPLRPWTAHPVVDRLARYSQSLYPEFVAAVEEEANISVEYAQNGLLIVGPEHIQPARKWASSTGASVEVVERPAMLRRVADLGRVYAGVWLEHVAQLRSPRLLQALERSVLRAGGQILPNQPIVKIETTSGKVERVLSRSAQICADQVVVAAGAWSGVIPGLEGLKLAIQPVRAQMIWLQDEPNDWGRPVLDDGEHYIVTRKAGVTVVGEILENRGFDQEITGKALKKLRNKAKSLIRTLSDAPVLGQWAGLLPARAHGIPLIGACPGVDGLFFNTGHFGNGVTLAPGSAVLLADLMEGQSKPGVGVATL